MSPNKSRLLLWSIALLPAAIAAVSLTEADWRSLHSILNSLGRITGVAGLSCLLAAAMLSSRVPGFDRYFGGLTKLWQTHHQIAGVSFLCLLAHPLLLAFAARGISLQATISVLIPPTATSATALGWMALILMMIFLAPSFAFFGEPKYQRWKLLHRLAGVVVVLAIWHTLLLERTIPRPWDTIIWFAYAFLALAAVAYRFFFSRTLFVKSGGRLPYTVDSLHYPSNDVVEISLRPKNKALKYCAGQFIYLTPYDKTLKAGYGQEHPFTITSSPTEEILQLSIKNLGDASRALQTIALGSEVYVEGPYGAFFAEDDDSQSELWIAGGIGIAPFIGRARYLAAVTDEVDVHLIYCVQDENRAHFAEELQAICGILPGFKLTLHYFYREGPLNAQFIKKHCQNLAYRTCYLCGPPVLLDCAGKILRSQGISKHNIYTEEFNLL